MHPGQSKKILYFQQQKSINTYIVIKDETNANKTEKNTFSLLPLKPEPSMKSAWVNYMHNFHIFCM